MPLLDEVSRFLPEEDTPDMKTQLDSQDFPQPGDHQSRNQTKKGIVGIPKTLQKIKSPILTAKAP